MVKQGRNLNLVQDCQLLQCRESSLGGSMTKALNMMESMKNEKSPVDFDNLITNKLAQKAG